MKKILLLSFLFIGQFTFAQDDYSFERVTEVIEEGPNYSQGTIVSLVPEIVLEFEGTLEDGYKYAKEYVLKNYNTPDEVIKAEIENDYFRFQGASNGLVFVTLGKRDIYYDSARFMIVINFREGRFKFEVQSLEHYSSINYEWYDVGLRWKVKNRKGKINPSSLENLSNVENYFINQAKTIQDYINKKGVVEDDDW